MLCATGRESTDGLATLTDGREMLGGMRLTRNVVMNGNVTPYRGQYQGYERGSYSYNCQTAVVFMGMYSLVDFAQPGWHFAEYSAEQDNDVWDFRLDYVRTVGPPNRIELDYNESWESKVE